MCGDKRPDASIHDTGESPPTLAAEVGDALHPMHNEKAPRPNNIMLEKIEALCDFENEVMTHLLNGVYDCGCISNDLLKSICVALPKKAHVFNVEIIVQDVL